MRSISLIAILSIGVSTAPPPQLTSAQIREDFGVFCSKVESTYAYFDAKLTRWGDVAALYERDLSGIGTAREFVELLERVIAELYDGHAHLTVNTSTSLVLVPSGADLWAEWVGGAATVTDVRHGSDAERSGMRPGAVVISVNGIPIADASERMIGRAVPKSGDAVRNWALRRVLAGRRGEARRIEADQLGSRRVFALPAERVTSTGDQSPVTFSRVDGDVGYVRINDSLGNSSTVAEFDRALAALRGTRALVVDLRNTPSGGNSTVARGILGRFVSREIAYQKHVLPAEERATGIRRSWIELVSPRGPFTYPNSVAVLVGRWTGSMGEGLAIGFDGVGSGTIVGGPMAQLLGATYRIDLPHSKIGISLPAERLYHVNGTPREAFLPRVRVSANARADRDAVLDAGIRTVLRARGRRGV